MHFKYLFVKGLKIINKKQNIGVVLGFTLDEQFWVWELIE